MDSQLSNLETDIANNMEDAKKAKELYELLSSYNAYNILLLKAKYLLEKKKLSLDQRCLESPCYTNQIMDLFALFHNNECLKARNFTGIQNMFFLLDSETLLRLTSFDNKHANINGLAWIAYDLLKADNINAKIFKQSVYCSTSPYGKTSYEDIDALGLFNNNGLIAQGFELDSQLMEYNNMDIQDILKTQSIDDIHEKMTEAKDNKVKKLILTKK